MTKIIRSPFFYVGDKYKLMAQIERLFPDDINTFIEPFLGGGSVFLNTNANRYIVNDLEANIVDLHKLFYSYKDNKEIFIEELIDIIKDYNLSCSFIGITAPEELKKKYVKTYYAKYNKDGYWKMRDSYNNSNDVKLLYLLLIYGFNHMIRFNNNGKFNLPVGNVDFNNNVYTAINNYMDFISQKNIEYYNMDYRRFISDLEIEKDDFIYFDPPYLLSNSEYNKMWDEEKEEELYNTIDFLVSKGIKFGLSNLLIQKGEENYILSKWMGKYNVYDIKSNYISYYDNSIKKSNKEVYITNVEKTRT
ncbi:MAG: Dam family site-specific DNA-(adenine-N6)-methyltransferase [Tissierellia bacterium]|nr:Dam family site-specific DNA-(adenine-N6)-methyltransferase [Tissierellia bacterium]MDD4726229.1 Dam family site-specific DNA-(adenine-N6)-methyltransferase [Tissierellia bacterium]